jgi:hypothetical protein
MHGDKIGQDEAIGVDHNYVVAIGLFDRAISNSSGTWTFVWMPDMSQAKREATVLKYVNEIGYRCA